jgi:hypothetical protein
LKSHIAEQTTKGLAGVGSSGILTLKCNDLPDINMRSKNVLKDGRINDDAVKQQIADRMLECWKMVGRGELDPYKKYDDNQAYCIICSDINFEKDFIEEAQEEKYQVKNFVYWLATHNAPERKTSYFEELYRKKLNDTATLNALKNAEFPLDITQQHAVIWRQEAEKKGLFSTVTGIGAVTVATALPGCIAAGAASAKVGAIVGGLYVGVPTAGVGTGVGAGVGAVAGALIGCISGGATGAAIGFFGSYVASETLFKDKLLYNGIMVLPKSALGEDLIIEENGNTYKKPICTRLVNY